MPSCHRIAEAVQELKEGPGPFQFASSLLCRVFSVCTAIRGGPDVSRVCSTREGEGAGGQGERPECPARQGPWRVQQEALSSGRGVRARTFWANPHLLSLSARPAQAGCNASIPKD